MTSSTYKPFGSVTSGSVDFSANSGFTFNGGFTQTQNQSQTDTLNSSEDVKEIFKSAVGDFSERPLQIMIREIAKSFIIFTPIGWIILMVLVARRYKGNFSLVFKNFADACKDVIASLGLLK